MPIKANAFAGHSVAQNITQTYYFTATVRPNIKQHKVFYRIKAQQQISQPHPKQLYLSFKKNTARQLLRYEKGSVQFDNARIHFQTAYFFRGIFYLEHTYGHINNLNFTAREIAFDRRQQRLNMEHVVFNEKNGKLTVRHNFQVAIQ